MRIVIKELSFCELLGIQNTNMDGKQIIKTHCFAGKSTFRRHVIQHATSQNKIKEAFMRFTHNKNMKAHMDVL